MLSIFHFVFGGLTTAVVLFGALSLAGDLRSGIGGPDAAAMIFVLIALGLHAFALVFVGPALRRPANLGLCVVANPLLCLFFPIGTLLGATTFFFLADRDARALYNNAPS